MTLKYKLLYDLSLPHELIAECPIIKSLQFLTGRTSVNTQFNTLLKEKDTGVELGVSSLFSPKKTEFSA